MTYNITYKIKHAMLAIFVGSTLVSCGGTQTEVAFYGYPDASGYEIAEVPVIGDDFYFAEENEQLYTASNVETEPLLIATKTVSTISEPNVYAVAGVPTPTELNAIVPASGGKAINAIPEHPATAIAPLPKCDAGATLARDANNVPTCFTPAADAQQACTDNAQCSSVHCVVGNDKTATQGACFSLLPFTGCENVLTNGKIEKVCS